MWGHPLSFTGGVYESKSSSVSASSDSGFVYRNGNTYVYNTAHNGYPVYRDTGMVNTTTSVQTVGLFVSPHFLLTSTPSKQNGFHLYLSVYAEMLWQRVTSTFDYSKANIDTVYYKTSLTGPNGAYRYNYKENTINLDYRSHYFGLGLPIYIKHDNYTFYLNPVLGATDQQFTFLQNTINGQSVNIAAHYNVSQYEYANPLIGFATPKNTWNMFYIWQFRLTSEQYGVSFTGEIRGMFLTQSTPIISLSISKKFDPGKFFESIFGKQ